MPGWLDASVTIHALVTPHFVLVVAGYYQPITQWSKGEYANANNVSLPVHSACSSMLVSHVMQRLSSFNGIVVLAQDM
jgi:hypothetical protein